MNTIERLSTAPVVATAWLEITGRCQLSCSHCYADSGPDGNHGSMNEADWRTVIDQLAALGCDLVQIIGGEPTLHPSFASLVDYALSAEIDVEVATNLVHVSPEAWELYEREGVSLSVSYYGATAAEYAMVTGTKGSHARTRANIAEAVRREIAIRINIVDVSEVQDVEAAVADVQSLGIDGIDIGVDKVRGIGRGTGHADDNGTASLCGECGHAKLAVLPNGDVSPCVIGRAYVTGNVKDAPLSDIVSGEGFRSTVREIKSATAQTVPGAPNAIKPCNPDICRPQRPSKPKPDKPNPWKKPKPTKK